MYGHVLLQVPIVVFEGSGLLKLVQEQAHYDRLGDG
jgi:hypothetical protein